MQPETGSRPASTSPGLGSISETTGITVPSSVDSGTTTSIHFTTIHKLLQDIRSVSGDTIRVHGVSTEDFDLIEKTPKRLFRLKRYYAALQLLIVTIPDAFHEHVHVAIYDEVVAEIRGMGLKSSWSSGGATTHRPPNGDGGEGDSSGRPRYQRRGAHAWPTIVVEAGYSESLQALRNDMRWWFSASNHEVKIVVLAKLELSQRLIILEKYQEVPAAQQTGDTLQPRLDQTIRITQAAGSIDAMDPLSYIVTRDALRLEFDLLFLRQPQPGEHDVIIGIQDLQLIASKVWE